MNESTIEKVVMRRVRRIHILSYFINGITVSCLLLAVALYAIGREVWVARVFQNGPAGFLGHSFYLFYAFEHTRLPVQLLSLLVLVSIIYLAREMARVISSTLVPVRA